MLSKEQLDKINYINLVAKTHYSIPFGVGKVKDQISSAAKKGHQGIAIVDDFAMNGILEAYSLSKDKDYIAKLKKEKFSIVLGTKINLTDNLELNDSSVFNVSIYAKNWTGYKNMTYLTSLSSMPGNGFVNSENFLTKRISFENLAERSEGLIIGSGDIDGILSQSIIKGNGQEEDLIQIFKEIFGDSFFIEIHYHPKTKFWNKTAKAYQEQTDDVQKIVNLELIKLAKKHNVKCCLVQNSYMHDKKYDYIQNILISNHKDFKKDGYFIDVPKYMMTVEEMYQYVQKNASYISDEEFVEFCENSIYFADLCKDIYLEFEPALPYIDYKLHPVNLPENAEKYEKLFHEYWAKVGLICPAMGEIFKIAHIRNDEALKTSLKALIRLEKMEWENIEWLDRLAIEIKVLTRNGVLNLLDYFLLLEDVTNFLRDIGKLRGWGRGSGGGSLLTYVMDVSDVQPLKYNLLFERFFTQDKIGVQYHEIENYPLSEYSSGKLKDIDEVILELDNLKKLFNNKKLKDVNQESLHKELYYIECNDELIKYYQNVAKKTTTANIKLENKNDSTLAYLLDITDSLPKKFIKHSEPSMPDFDYDTDGRDEVKAYLTKKNGYKHTTLIGTLGSLKTKGAVKDVIRQLRPDMDVTKEVNPLTEKFNVIKTTDEEKIRDTLQLAMAQKNIDYSGIDFKSELAYFYACLEAEPKLNEWFSQNQNVKDAVVLLLGNAKGTGVHAGGIVVSRKEIMELCPLTWSYDENIWVTQYEMTYVEKAGLIKYDFLGLSTLQDFNRVLKLINSRYPEKIVLSKIPMDDKVIFDLFIQGKTESVFQFNGPLPISILTQLKEVRGIDDLAMITSIARPGPLAMGMDRTFIRRNTGEDSVEFLHPKLEPILQETYGLLCIAKGQKVLTKSGQVNIEDVSEGSYVLTEDGSYQKVLKNIYKGQKQTVRVRMTNGEELVCTKDHKVLTQYGWKEAGSLTNQDLVKSFWIGKKANNIGDDRDWLIGLALADGDLTATTPVISCSSRSFALKVKKIAEKEFGLKSVKIFFNTRCWYVSLGYRKAKTKFLHNDRQNPFTSCLRKLGLYGKDCYTKRLPKNPSLSMIAGFIEGDGSLINFRVRLKNEKLAYDLYLALQAHRIPSSFFIDKDGATTITFNDFERRLPFKIKKIAHNIQINKTNVFIPRSYLPKMSRTHFKSRAQLTSPFHKNKPLSLNNFLDLGFKLKKDQHAHWSKVLSVKPDEINEVYDLSIDKIHSFVVGGHVVHNCYQEQVMLVAKYIGELDSIDSVKFMKALSKKKPEAVAKLIDKINKTATTKYNFKPEVAKELMDTMQAFSLYAFNKSHAAAYACVSYLCMWFKHYYPAEWISAVLSGAKKEDLEILYPKWKDYIVPPSINQSKDSFQINEDNKVVMPFNAVNGIGEKAVIEIIKKQPYASFEDFMNRVDLGVVNKTSVLAMIFTGIFDSFKPDEETSQRWRKILVRDYFKLKFALAEKRTGKKTSKKDIEEAKKFFEDEVVKMNRSAILMKEISLLNFTAFDYYDYYRREMTDGARVKFGKQAIRPGEVQKYPTDSTVVVGGMIEDIEFKRTKKGGEMAVLKLSNDGHTLDVMIFGRQIEEDDASESKMIRNLKKYMPIIIKGKVNRWNGRLSLVWGDAHILL